MVISLLASSELHHQCCNLEPDLSTVMLGSQALSPFHLGPLGTSRSSSWAPCQSLHQVLEGSGDTSAGDCNLAKHGESDTVGEAGKKLPNLLLSALLATLVAGEGKHIEVLGPVVLLCWSMKPHLLAAFTTWDT